jgi:hypothetical protein
MIKLQQILLLAILLTVTGCLPVSEAMPSTTITPRVSPSATMIIEVSPTITAITTLIPATTALPSPTSVLTPTPFNFVTRCPEAVPANDNIIMSSGSLLLRRTGSSSTWIWPYNAQQPQVLLEEPVLLHISPYSGTLAWFEETAIKFRKPTGQELQFPRDESWYDVRQFLSDDRVIINAGPAKNSKTPSEAVDEFYILSPDTGSAKFYSLKMFGFFAPPFALRQPTRPIYNATLTRAIYDAGESGIGSDAGQIMWDVENQAVVWSKDNWGWPLEFSWQTWQLDGSHVVLTAPPLESNVNYPPELISVAVDGKAEQLTHLRDFVNDSDGYLIFQTKWSPNERYIAFVFVADPIASYERRFLYVLDTQSGTITDYCISPVGRGSGLFWSPKSDQLAFTVDDREVAVLDIVNAKVQILPEYVDVEGWVGWTP